MVSICLWSFKFVGKELLSKNQRSQRVISEYIFYSTKGQTISKANYGVLNTNEAHYPE